MRKLSFTTNIKTLSSLATNMAPAIKCSTVLSLFWSIVKVVCPASTMLLSEEFVL